MGDPDANIVCHRLQPPRIIGRGWCRQAECPGEPPIILQGVNAADLRKHVVRELCLEGDNRIVQGSMSDMLAERIGEEAIAIEYASIAVVRRAGSRSPKTS